MKLRLDRLVLLRGLAQDLHQAQALILAGKVVVNGHRADKSGMPFSADSNITIKASQSPFVSRGGLKLQAGLRHFQINPDGLVCADIGASTGGFTDCLLQNGAKKVYAIDVGYGQLHWKLRQDPRVVVMERTNARHLKTENFSEQIQLAVIDASFISLTTILPPLLPLLDHTQSILALIKPQFEVIKEAVERGGIVTNDALHNDVIEKIRVFSHDLSLTWHGFVQSPIMGPKGNKEFLIFLCSGLSS